MQTLSLKFRFAIVMSAGALALVAGLGALSVHFTERDLVKTISEQQSGLAARAADDLDAKLQLAMNSLETATSAMPIAVVTDHVAFAAFFEQHPSLLQLFDELVIVNARGRIAATFPVTASGLGADLSDRRYFRDAMQTKKPLISDPLRHRRTGLPIVNIVVPIDDDDGNVIAMMVGVMALSKKNMLGDLSSARLGESGFFAVMTRAPGAVYLAHPDPARIMEKVPVAENDALRQVASATGAGSLFGRVADGRDALISYHPLAQRRWVLEAALPTQEALATIDRARERAFAVGGFAALVVLPLVWCFASWLLRPLDRLRREVERIGRDEGGEGFATVEGRDEIGRVAAAFNAMVAGQRASEAQRIASDHARRRLVAMLESSHDFVAMTDADGRLTYLNATARAGSGIAPDDDLSTTTINEFFPEWAVKRLFATAVPAALARGMWVGESAVRTRDGREIPVDHTLIAHRNVHGRVEFFSSLLHDTAAAAEAAAAMRATEARMLSIANALTVHVAFLDLDYRFRFVNSRYEDHFGVDKSELLGKSLLECFGAAAHAVYLPYFGRAAAGETVEFERESGSGIRGLHFLVKVIPHRDENGDVVGYHMFHQDVSAHKAEQRRLSELVRADALTGLLNRAGFDAAIDEAMARCRRNGAPIALCYLDVDRFKAINDEHGHPVGDALLRAFADRLLRAVRGSDIVARLGGDEFVVIAEGLRTVDDIRAVASKVLRAMRAEFAVGGVRLSVTTSIGVATYSGDGMTGEQLINRADAALYRAKKAGRNRWDIDDPSQPVTPTSIDSGEALEATIIL